MMGVPPKFVGYDTQQGLFDLAHISPGRKPSPIGDPEDVCIDGDRRLTEGDVEHDIGRLSADAGERLQGLSRCRHASTVAIAQYSACRQDIPRLRVIEADRLDVLAQPFLAEFEQGLRGVRLGEETGRGLVDGLVGRLCRQHDGDQQFEVRSVDEFGLGLGIDGL